MRYVFKLEYQQKFSGQREWLDYSDTIVAPDAKEAIRRLTKIAGTETLGENRLPCTGVRVMSVERVCEVTR